MNEQKVLAGSENEKKNQAFHLFLYLSLFFSLGFVVFGTIGILFSLVDKLFEISLDLAYQEYLRSSIAALAIAVPIYHTILYLINRKFEKGDIHPDSIARKAISYLAVFVFFAMSIGSLVSLLFGYLNGTLAEVSFFKALIFLVISALLLSFYFWEIRRNIFTGKMFNAFFSSSLLIAFLSIVVGFAIVDSPKVTREKKQDVKIVEAMENIKYRINDFYFNNERLMNDDEFGNIGIDKEVRDKIIYNQTGSDEYELCADFNYSFEAGYLYEQLKDEWRFQKGQYCFKLKVKVEKGVRVE